MPLVVHPVRDVDAATKLYSALLGVEPYVSSPYYVGFRVGDQELGLDPNGHRSGLTGPTPYWEVDDIEDAVARLTAAGATVSAAVSDVGGGKLVARLADGDGNIVGLVQNP
jgi:predicted enzyme related to lactoylglutathione lyase